MLYRFMPLFRYKVEAALILDLRQYRIRCRDDGDVDAAGEAELQGLGGVFTHQQFAFIDIPDPRAVQSLNRRSAVRGEFRVGINHAIVIIEFDAVNDVFQVGAGGQLGTFRDKKSYAAPGKLLDSYRFVATISQLIYVFPVGRQEYLEGSPLLYLAGEIAG